MCLWGVRLAPVVSFLLQTSLLHLSDGGGIPHGHESASLGTEGTDRSCLTPVGLVGWFAQALEPRNMHGAEIA